MVFAPLTLAMTDPYAQLSRQIGEHDVIWRNPSEDAAGSMPIGNGRVVLNAWVEKSTGDLLFYIARDDALSEISRILKLGRVRVHFTEGPWRRASDFQQRLDLWNGVIRLSGSGLEARLFVDPDHDVVHLVGTSKRPVIVSATLESWRNEPRKLPAEEKASAWSVHDAPFDLVESADVRRVAGDAFEWYHRNESSVVPKLWENQSLTGLRGTFDPLLHRTFGGRMDGQGMLPNPQGVSSRAAGRNFSLRVGTHAAQTPQLGAWTTALRRTTSKSFAAQAEARAARYWNEFWSRSWVFAKADAPSIPTNQHPLTVGRSWTGAETFQGDIEAPNHETSASSVRLSARIRRRSDRPGRIFDKITPGGRDGFLFDTYPGDGLRFIVGDLTLEAAHVLSEGEWHLVEAEYDVKSGSATIRCDGRIVAQADPMRNDPMRNDVGRAYTLQRFVQACQGRGEYPIKFNGGSYTVEPKAMGKPFNADWRNWGDAHWFQNVRHMTHPMMPSGDWEMTDPFFRLYERARPLAEARTQLYHHAHGAYFPETMTVFGTYSGGDYGWDRTGLQPKDVQSPWWQFAWNQGPELVALMLDRWDYTGDQAFLRRRLLPMAESVLKYFDTRFRKDPTGKIVLDPTQVVETYWTGVVNDAPTVAGLIAITDRLLALPGLSPEQRSFFSHMRQACPALPIEMTDGLPELAPAERYDPKRTNVENGELYPVWPFRLVSLSRPSLLQEAKRAYEHRGNHLDVGWGYDGNAAALLGLTEEAARILRAKISNSNPAYRWPATWGPNFDWLPDQNHGGNLLNQTQLMLLQAEPLSQGGKIRVLPAWPKDWDADFLLWAPNLTQVRCVAKQGRIISLRVTPASRAKDIVWPDGWQRPAAK